MHLAVGVGSVVFSLPFFEDHCARNTASLGRVGKIALCACSFVPAWHVKWSVRSKSVITNSMESSNFVIVPETAGGTVGGTACRNAVKLSVENAAWETSAQEIAAREIAAREITARKTAALQHWRLP